MAAKTTGPQCEDTETGKWEWEWEWDQGERRLK